MPFRSAQWPSLIQSDFLVPAICESIVRTRTRVSQFRGLMPSVDTAERDGCVPQSLQRAASRVHCASAPAQCPGVYTMDRSEPTPCRAFPPSQQQPSGPVAILRGTRRRNPYYGLGQLTGKSALSPTQYIRSLSAKSLRSASAYCDASFSRRVHRMDSLHRLSVSLARQGTASKTNDKDRSRFAPPCGSIVWTALDARRKKSPLRAGFDEADLPHFG